VSVRPTGIEWLPLDEVPGGVLSRESERQLREKLDDLADRQRRARFRFDREWRL
jgi:hypothetical protein